VEQPISAAPPRKTGPLELIVLNGNGHAPGEPVGATADNRVAALTTVAPAANDGAARTERQRPAAPDPDVAGEIAQWRARLREGRNEAAEVITLVEQRLAAGNGDPALNRVLGEAYLRLGRSDLAAAQFRAATARRVRRP
jgi:hypothetical protein